MRKGLRSIWYSFPLQLFVLHIKRNHFLAVSWLFLLSVVLGITGSRYGIPLLFLDPEYSGAVNFSSFCIVGAAFGAFIIVWNVTSYILNAHSFSFLATLSRPFGIYCLNNSIFPVSILIVYIFRIIAFQSAEGLLPLPEIAFCLFGFTTGMLTMIMISMIYFFRTNKDIFQIIGIIKRKEEKRRRPLPEEPTHEQVHVKNIIRTEYYLNHQLQWRHARSADHYPESVIRSVYKQHHANALFIEITSIVLIILFGFMMDNHWFRIPAAASIFLLVTILIVLIGAYYYWMGAWKVAFFFILLFILNSLIRSNMLSYQNKVYGLNYDQKIPYTKETVNTLADTGNANADRRNMLQQLNNWRSKFGDQKPKFVLITCSGGGSRASSFVLQVMQQADSVTSHALMQQCPLITGASGGMIAAAYYRELYLRSLTENNIRLQDPQYVDKISSDLLNALGFTIVVNDLFYPWQQFHYNNETYRKDRGYMFEKILNENTDSVMCKSLGDYADAEFSGTVPMLLFTPTIINDERKLYIASQPVSFLAKPLISATHMSEAEVEGVDIHHLLGDAAGQISYTSVLRMNCTFPYILPMVHLPTDPDVVVMDAGIRDNFGIQTAVQFASVFSDWINENTSGVVIVNIRAMEQDLQHHTEGTNGLIQKFTSPVENLYSNWIEIQDYQNDQSVEYLNQLLNGHVSLITFEYQPSEKSKRASLSLHLTAKEKEDIFFAAGNAYNKVAYDQLHSLLNGIPSN